MVIFFRYVGTLTHMNNNNSTNVGSHGDLEEMLQRLACELSQRRSGSSYAPQTSPIIQLNIIIITILIIIIAIII